jgi:uncharacterized membrane-anchored protein YhcB (DUF1043 family)
MFRKITRQGSLLNPFIQALPFAIIAIFFLPDIFNKYKAEIIQSNSSPDRFVQKYIDIDGDALNEKVILHYGTEYMRSNSNISVFSLNDVPLFDIALEHPWIGLQNLFYADLNKDDKNEIFVFTKSEDTIFLNQIQYQSDDSIKFNQIQVEKTDLINDAYNISISHIGNSDVNEDGNEEFVFLLMSAVNKKIRGVYAWDLTNNTIIRSPEFGISLVVSQHYMCDIDQDGYNEIILSTSSNTLLGSHLGSNDNLPYPDTASYVLVLDHDLSLLFDPITVKCRSLYSLPLLTKYGLKIASLIGIEKEGKITQQINLYNIDGSLFKSKEINFGLISGLDWIFTKNSDIDDEFFIAHTKGLIECFNSDLECIDYWEIEPLEGYPIKPIDLDNDGNNEFIFKKVANSIYAHNFIITQNDLNFPVNVNMEGKLEGISLTHKDIINHKGIFLFQLSNQDSYLFKFHKNSYHKVKYFIWGLIYTILVTFIALVQWAQRIKTQNKTNKEKELAKFQLMAIKNQVDPHFTLNTLNAISSLYGKGENQEAYKYMTKLSRLMLLVLNESDQISSTLKAEIEMIKNYIELQLIRFNDCFDYTINWDEEKLGDREVPRMLIHTFTENAIKHGLRTKTKGGLLSISIREKNKHLFIVIEDNGIGRKAAAMDKSLSSGKGVGISNSICQLYHQLRNVKVNYSITDLYKIDKSTNKEVPAGTRVTITVHPKLFKI